MNYCFILYLFILLVTICIGAFETIQEKWPNTYGSIFIGWFGLQAFVNLASPSLIEVWTVALICKKKYFEFPRKYTCTTRVSLFSIFSQKILSSQTFINKGNFYDPLLPWLGKGLLLASGTGIIRGKRRHNKKKTINHIYVFIFFNATF